MKTTRRTRSILPLALVTLATCWVAGLMAAPPKLPRVAPEDAGMNSERLSHIAEIVADGLDRERMPGCVVLIGRHGRVVFWEAYGFKQVQPDKVRMTVDAVFDMASITKPVATATSIMKLSEQGKIRLDERVATYIPEFGHKGKESVTVTQLLTHQGGLIPDNSLKDYQDGRDLTFQRIYDLEPFVEPGTKFVYTDVGYIVLAELVQRVSGRTVHEFSQEHVFQPLGMSETGYLPDEVLRKRAAPTEQRDDHWMQGEVHDPRAYRLGGIAGHAGLFSTATDLAVYAQMLLGRGTYQGVCVLETQTVDAMIQAQLVSSGRRGLGWDIKTGYSSNRGDLFSPRAFGHGGFTGTSLWMDPELDLFVVFLSNRVHPDGKGSVNALAGRIGTVAAAAIVDSPKPVSASQAKEDCVVVGDSSRPARSLNSPVLTGINVLERDRFRQLKGRHVGLITNHTGINRSGVSTARLLADAPDVELVALFSPEHGLAGKLDQSQIADARDPETGRKVHSLYGKTRKPTPESLKGIDTLVFDIQDIGARFYTYISTMGHAMQVAAEQKIRFVVIDRPNPINGVDVAGPMLDAGRESFVAFHSLPVRHGMTVGELAGMFNAELNMGVDLHVIRIEGWRRSDFFDATGLIWTNPSPNMRSLTEALLYPGIGLLETTNLSVGRGTDTPFEVIGAPWLDGSLLAQELNAAGLAGVRFLPIRFTPESSKFQGELCGGINIAITDRSAFQPVRTGLEIACRLQKLFPDTWSVKAYGRLLGSQATLDALMGGHSVADLEAGYQRDLQRFRERRQSFLLY